MEYKLNLPKVQSYSLALAEKISNEYFQGNLTISGPDILKCSTVEQVNLFIIKNLFDKWKEESLKLRSPYFDYENNEVKEALNFFLNKVSRHIAIRKEFFKPLLQKAIADTITFLLTPYDFINIEYLNKSVISYSDITEREKYIRIHKNLLKLLIEEIESTKGAQLSGQELQQKFRKIYEQHPINQDDVRTIIGLLSSMLKVAVEDLTSGMPKEVQQETAMPAIKQADLFSDKETTLYQKFGKPRSTLNDTLRKETGTTLADKLRRSKVQDLKSSIPLNMKFLFINELFNSMSDEYNNALNMIDNCDTIEAVRNVISNDLAKKFNWNFEKNEVKEFIEMAERKFN